MSKWKAVLRGHISVTKGGLKRSNTHLTNNPAYPFQELVQRTLEATRSTNPDILSVFYSRS